MGMHSGTFQAIPHTGSTAQVSADMRLLFLILRCSTVPPCQEKR